MHQSLLECKFDRHQKSKIIGVCVHKQCQNRRPFCVGCQYQFHQDHIDDLKFFDDLKDWVLQNSQITVGITTYLNELIDLVKSISQLIEATQYANQHSNFNQMNYTDLENSINYLMNLWNCQNNVNQLLQEMLITKTRNQIKQLCSFYFLQYTTNNKIQVNQQSLQLNQNLTQKQITEGPQNVIQSKNQQQIPDQRISNLSKRFQQPNREQIYLSQSLQFQKNQFTINHKSISPHRNEIQNAIKVPKQNKVKNLEEY